MRLRAMMLKADADNAREQQQQDFIRQLAEQQAQAQ
jgi:hypothetical protein